MPLLEGEHRLRLLNYQNNMLRKICHLQGLPNLIFLDLYNNRIERIEGLACVPALRVLMLGKTSIRNVENLEPLRKLDVLDLHRIASPKFSGYRISQSCGCSTWRGTRPRADNWCCEFDRAQSEAESDPARADGCAASSAMCALEPQCD